ncbi:conserved Plasmodium protein, unknown function [Plasmodium berghei]|uniref:Uncharacterized protein n=1 Tax=Plasmodium berghei TaxID=5821 RepID=A0A1D3S754_PLABE|nr:conserved Plasmodium protein, unknown function [Plasmodium berghei]
MEDKIIQTHITILLYLMLIVYLKSFTINLGDMPKKLFTYIKVYYAFLIVITIVAFFRRLFLLFYLYITNSVNKLFNYVLLKDSKNEANYIKSYGNKNSAHDIFFQNNLESEILNKYLNENKIDFYKYFLFCDDLISYDKNTSLCLTNKSEIGQNEISFNNSISMECEHPNKTHDNNFLNGEKYNDKENDISFSNPDSLYDVANNQTDRSNSLNRINTKFSRKIYNFFFRKNNNLVKKTFNKRKDKVVQEKETQKSKNDISNLGENKPINDNETDNHNKSNEEKYINNHIKSFKLNKDRYFQKHLIKFKHLKFITFMLDLLNNYKKYIMIDKIIKQFSRCTNNTNQNTLNSSIELNKNNAECISKDHSVHNNFNINNEKQNDELILKNINNLEKTFEQFNCMTKNNNKLENSNLFPSNIFGNMFNTNNEKKSQKTFFQNINFHDNNNNKESVNTEKEMKKNNVILKSILKKNNSNLKNEENSKNKNKKHIRFNPKVQTLLFEKYYDEEEYIYNMNNGKKGLYKIIDEYNIKNSDIFSYYNMRNSLNSIFTDIVNSVYVYKDKISRKF